MWPKRKASSPAKVRASGLIRPLRTSACRRPATSPTSSGGERSATAPHQKTCPITAARCSTANSSSPSRSRRAASTAWTVSGTRSDVDGRERLEPAVALDEDAVLDEHPQHLLEEERVAAGRAADRVGGVRVERAGQVLEQRAHVLPRQRRQLDRRPSPRRPQLREVRARHAADEDRRVATPAGEVLDEVEEGRLRPLDVVEHEHERLLARERLEQAADRRVELIGARAWLRPADGLEDAPARRLAVGLAAEHRLEVEVAYHLDERPVGDPVAVRQTAAFEHERLRRRRSRSARRRGGTCRRPARRRS